MIGRLSSILLILLLAAPVSGNWWDDPRNAATWYWRAIDAYESIDRDQLNAMYEWDQKTGSPPPPALRSVLTRLGPAFDAFQRGSVQQYSDFHLDRSQGWEMLIPHLGRLRQVARAMELDARVRLHDGDSTGATNRIAALYRSSVHLADDRILISSLVGQSMFFLADHVTQYAIDTAAFNAGDAALLLQTARELEGRDPFGYLEAVISEAEITVDWLPQKYEEQDFEDMALMEGDDDWLGIADLSPDEFYGREMPLYGEYMNGVIDIFAMENPEAAKAAFERHEADLLEGRYGEIARLLSPAFGRVLDSRETAAARINMRIESLAELAEGEVEPADNANAAYHYLQGLSILATLPPEQLFALRTFEPTLGAAVSDDLADCLLAMQEAVAPFRAGSQLRRCDFSFGGSVYRHGFIHDHDAGMRDAFRLLVADAIHLFENEEVEDAVDRLAISYRMIGHFSTDEQIVSSLIAHRSFSEAHGVVASAIEQGLINPQQKSALASAFNRIGRADPFGYVTAGRTTRETMLRRLSRHFNPDQTAMRENAEKLEAAIRGGGGEFLLNLLALREEMGPVLGAKHRAEAIQAGYLQPEPEVVPQEDGDRVEPPHPLTGVLAVDQLPAMQALAAKVVHEHELRESPVLKELEAIRLMVPGLGMVAARSELRAAGALLNPGRLDQE